MRVIGILKLYTKYNSNSDTIFFICRLHKNCCSSWQNWKVKTFYLKTENVVQIWICSHWSYLEFCWLWYVYVERRCWSTYENVFKRNFENCLKQSTWTDNWRIKVAQNVLLIFRSHAGSIVYTRSTALLRKVLVVESMQEMISNLKF